MLMRWRSYRTYWRLRWRVHEVARNSQGARGPLFSCAWRPEAGEVQGRVRWQKQAAWGCGQAARMQGSNTHASKRVRNQALLPSVISGERGKRALEEGHLGGEDKMAAPTAGNQESFIIINRMRKVMGRGSR
ncbi:hypothetical protein NDU88_007825 [Pleurodeles waltl]|uniref:Uncharacterized protein n=1 Tax=Pleurodeles waltl TaxID=8319 RepID=A0AAV7VTG5_PLEWA|nr:hypothetical protein NDU88_007825 [Pleurodeles waltl]